MQQFILNQMTNAIFKAKLEALFKRNFLELDMEAILNFAFRFFEDYSGKMSMFTGR